MSFFNKKEEVISIELTNYGRELLTKGTFKPVYYSFYDNEIIYNSSCMSQIELQNETEERILQNSFTIKPQTKVTGSVDDSSFGIIDTKLLANLLGEPIGLSDSSVQYMPSWNINFLNAEIEQINSGSTIPEIILKDTYVDIIIEKDFSNNFSVGQNEIILLTPKENGDDSFVKLKNASVIMSIKEENVIDIGENFLIEILYGDNEQQLNIYNSAISNFNVVDDNNILLDKTEEDQLLDRNDPLINELFIQDKNNIELHFNVSGDLAISDSEFTPERLAIYDNIAGGSIQQAGIATGIPFSTSRQPFTADNGIGNNEGEVCN